MQIRKSFSVWSVRHALAYGKRSSRYGDECGLFWWFQTVVCGCVRIVTARSFHREMCVHDKDTVGLQRPFISSLPSFLFSFPGVCIDLLKLKDVLTFFLYQIRLIFFWLLFVWFKILFFINFVFQFYPSVFSLILF